MFAVGIDLGTTNSAVAILKGRAVIVEDITGNRTLPSAVGWDPDLEQLVLGIDAKNDPATYNTILSVKRDMGTDKRFRVGPNNWLPEEVSAEILKTLKRQVEEKTGEQVTDAVITVPAYFQMAAMAATKRAGELAGLNVQQLLAEPSAAVMAYGPRDDEKILVYDLGGGTFDCTIVDYFAGMLSTLAVFGNNFLGGDDFDQRIMNWLVEVLKKEQGVTIDLEHDRAAAAILKREAEKAKIELSRNQGARINIPKVVSAQGRPIGLQTILKRADFNAMIGDLVKGSLHEAEKALNHAKLDKKDIDTVLLVGGSTYVPLVQEMVRDFFGKAPNKSVNPDLAVALGAATSVLEPPSSKHVVKVDFIPEATPLDTLQVEGRTTPNSQVKISGGTSDTVTTAGADGRYVATVPLNRGMNKLVVTATDPKGQKAMVDPEPVVFDPAAVVTEAPPPPPQPKLPRALSISCGTSFGPNMTIDEWTSQIIAQQTELPARVSKSDFGTSVDNQQVLVGRVLEGDLPIAGLNTYLAEIRLDLPPNVPANERVIIHYTIDENFNLTAELEVPSIKRKAEVKINIQSATQQVHVFIRAENLLRDLGQRIRPEERAQIEQSKLALEDMTADLRNLLAQQFEGSTAWNLFQRIKTESQRLETLLVQMAQKYLR